jgi:hypothetical protein
VYQHIHDVTIELIGFLKETIRPLLSSRWKLLFLSLSVYIERDRAAEFAQEAAELICHITALPVHGGIIWRFYPEFATI